MVQQWYSNSGAPQWAAAEGVGGLGAVQEVPGLRDADLNTGSQYKVSLTAAAASICSSAVESILLTGL